MALVTMMPSNMVSNERFASVELNTSMKPKISEGKLQRFEAKPVPVAAFSLKSKVKIVAYVRTGLIRRAITPLNAKFLTISREILLSMKMKTIEATNPKSPKMIAAST